MTDNTQNASQCDSEVELTSPGVMTLTSQLGLAPIPHTFFYFLHRKELLWDVEIISGHISWLFPLLGEVIYHVIYYNFNTFKYSVLILSYFFFYFTFVWTEIHAAQRQVSQKRVLSCSSNRSFFVLLMPIFWFLIIQIKKMYFKLCGTVTKITLCVKSSGTQRETLRAQNTNRFSCNSFYYAFRLGWWTDL